MGRSIVLLLVIVFIEVDDGSVSKLVPGLSELPGQGTIRILLVSETDISLLQGALLRDQLRGSCLSGPTGKALGKDRAEAVRIVGSLPCLAVPLPAGLFDLPPFSGLSSGSLLGLQTFDLPLLPGFGIPFPARIYRRLPRSVGSFGQVGGDRGTDGCHRPNIQPFHKIAS